MLALIHIHTLGVEVPVSGGAATLESPRLVDTFLAGTAGGGTLTFIHILTRAVGGGAITGRAAAVGGRGVVKGRGV